MRTLRSYLALLVIGAMLPGAVLTAALVWRVFVNTRAASERRLLDAARVDAAALDREFRGAVEILTALGTSPSIERDDLASFHAEALRTQGTKREWHAIHLLSPDGTRVVDTSVPWSATRRSVRDAESLQRAISTGQPAVGLIRSEDGVGPLVNVRLPIYRNGSLKYVLSAALTLEWLAGVVPRQLADSEEWTRIILDPAGTIAVRTRGGEGYVGSPATETFRARISRSPETISAETTRDGLPVYAATARSQHGWTTAVVVPRQALDAPLDASITALVLGGGLLIASGLFAAFRVSTRLSADLTSATEAAESVARGSRFTMHDGRVAETARLQDALASAATLLEQRARERDREIERADQARADAELANRAKDQFLAVLGHELRNPLSPVMSALELMRRQQPDAFVRERQIIERQVTHMTRLVDDLLDISRLSRGEAPLTRRPFELCEAVDRACEMVQPLVAAQRHELVVSCPRHGLVVDGDVHRIVQVLTNLLTNAVKYTPPGGRITLSAEAQGSSLRITCQDNGPGLPADVKANLFLPFTQSRRGIDRRDGGLGLGLALASSFVRLHGGTLSFEAPEDGGARFVITLPAVLTRVAAARVETPAAMNGVRPGRRVLVVDDNADAIEMLGAALRAHGHDVATASSAAEALTMVDAFEPGIAILDIGLPDLNGYELARRLKQSRPTLPLIALTGYGQHADVEQARAAGFHVHYTKPAPLDVLLDTISRVNRDEAQA